MYYKKQISIRERFFFFFLGGGGGGGVCVCVCKIERRGDIVLVSINCIHLQ